MVRHVRDESAEMLFTLICAVKGAVFIDSVREGHGQFKGQLH